MDRQSILAWLLAFGGPSIRYRTAFELSGDRADIERLRQEMLDSAVVKSWLARLVPGTHLNDLHGSKPAAFENAMGKLVQLGCACGMPRFDARTQFFRTWLAGEIGKSGPILYTQFPHILVSAFLVMAGYADDAARQVIARRLETITSFARKGDFDIYVDKRDYPGVPKGFHNHQLVNPALYHGDDMQLPYIYDLYAFAHLPDTWRNETINNQIETIIDAILHPDYQRLPEGYGIMKSEGRPVRYWAIGWNIDLPGYFGFERLSKWEQQKLLPRMRLMAHFPNAVRHPWFTNVLAHLETFRTDEDCYRFPRSCLVETPLGYWVNGNHMGLEENRRSKQAIELGSTFWMLKIAQLAA
jgi:hypothetical protein